jgi:hypothetical protein
MRCARRAAAVSANEDCSEKSVPQRMDMSLCRSMVRASTRKAPGPFARCSSAQGAADGPCVAQCYPRPGLRAGPASPVHIAIANLDTGTRNVSLIWASKLHRARPMIAHAVSIWTQRFSRMRRVSARMLTATAAFCATVARAPTGWACPNCPLGKTARQQVCDQAFMQNLLLAFIPFAAVIVVALWAERIGKRERAPRTTEKRGPVS